jgi:methionyl-tRNA formyltransferase
MMRILFAGTPALAVPSLEKAAHAHEVVGVLTSPDQPSGRGRPTVCSPVKEAATRLGLRVLQPPKLDAAFLDEVRALAPDVLVVAAFGKIFRKSLLDLFPFGGINVHPSLLPRHRGPSPITAAILAGDPQTGVTIQKIALKFDTGDVYAQVSCPLKGDETTATLTAALAAAGAELLETVLAGIAAGRPAAARAQNDAEATYSHTLTKEDGVVRWEEPAEIIERKVRAFDPWPRASTARGSEILLLLKSHVYPATLGGDQNRLETPGAVAGTDKDHGLLVRTGRGILAVERLQPQFKKPMDWRSFVNGHPDIIGARLGTQAGDV